MPERAGCGIASNPPRRGCDYTGTHLGYFVPDLELDTAYADFDLTLARERRPDGLHGTVSHATDAYPAATAAELTDRYGLVLGSLARDPRTGIGELHGATRAVVPDLST
ncbi:hypothetical protein I0C86_39620 [Plantactinospora sp. S1510]|uniref:Uncharacterized protein n=1 Tax=Plantactinospora alkalitolerans TaxID=2789879 RepID=A0ABS0H937_9ACTN|nr:hypothetical protein [Plantactinospora alkalitolerans]MBF9134990.1 hypothetical protein [Plantactinospora alkalitolerans]